MAGPGTPPTDSNTGAVMHALTVAGVDSEDAHNATQGTANLAGRAIIAALEVHKAELGAKIDTHSARIDAKIDSQRWLIGIGLTLLGVLITLMRLLA